MENAVVLKILMLVTVLGKSGFMVAKDVETVDACRSQAYAIAALRGDEAVEVPVGETPGVFMGSSSVRFQCLPLDGRGVVATPREPDPNGIPGSP